MPSEVHILFDQSFKCLPEGGFKRINLDFYVNSLDFKWFGREDLVTEDVSRQRGTRIGYGFE